MHNEQQSRQPIAPFVSSQMSFFESHKTAHLQLCFRSPNMFLNHQKNSLKDYVEGSNRKWVKTPFCSQTKLVTRITQV